MSYGNTFKQGLKNGFETTWVLGKVIFPVTLIVTILQFTPLIEWVVLLCEPLMGFIGLRGEVAILLTMLIAYIWKRIERRKERQYHQRKGVQHEI